MDEEIMVRGYAAYAMEKIFNKDSPVHSLKGKKLREWIQNAGMARVAVDRIFARKRPG